MFYRSCSVESVTSSECTVFKKYILGPARWKSGYRYLLPKPGDLSSIPKPTQRGKKRTNFRESSMHIYHGMHAPSPNIRHAHTSNMHARAHTHTNNTHRHK